MLSPKGSWRDWEGAGRGRGESRELGIGRGGGGDGDGCHLITVATRLFLHHDRQYCDGLPVHYLWGDQSHHTMSLPSESELKPGRRHFHRPGVTLCGLQDEKIQLLKITK